MWVQRGMALTARTGAGCGKDGGGARMRSSVVATKTLLGLEDMPRPKGLPFIGTKLSLIASGGGSRLHEYIDSRHKQLGPIFQEKLNSDNIVFLSDPELMRTVLLKLEGKYPKHILPDPWILYNKTYGCKRGLFFMDGEEWMFHRKIMNKHLLRSNSVDWLRDPTVKATSDFVQRFKSKTSSGNNVVDMGSEFYRLSLDVIVSILLGSSSLHGASLRYNDLLNVFSEAVRKIFYYSAQMFILPASFYANLNRPAWVGFTEAADTSLKLARKLVNEILSNKSGLGDGLIYRLSQENITLEKLTSLVVDFIIAAGDTTSYSLLWTLYLLTKNENILRELENLIETESPNLDSFVNNILKESLRLYPVAPFLTRIIMEQSALANYLIPAGTPVVLSIYTSGRDEKYFTNPEQFIPQRWDNGGRHLHGCTEHKPYATLPFALGTRSCIGKKIAQIQLTEAIVQIVKTFRLELQNTEDVQMITSMVSVPKEPIRIKFIAKT